MTTRRPDFGGDQRHRIPIVTARSIREVTADVIAERRPMDSDASVEKWRRRPKRLAPSANTAGRRLHHFPTAARHRPLRGRLRPAHRPYYY
jgi:hypothetical protein